MGSGFWKEVNFSCTKPSKSSLVAVKKRTKNFLSLQCEYCGGKHQSSHTDEKFVLILSFPSLLTLPPIILTRFRGIKSGFFHPPVSKFCITLLLLQSASKGTL